MLGIEVDTVSLDADQFSYDSKTHELARVVSEEVEAQRAIEGGRKPQSNNYLRQLLIDPDVFFNVASQKRWYEFVTEFGLLQRCAKRLQLELLDVIERITKEIHPPNWQALFWMHAWLKVEANQRRKIDKFAALVRADERRKISEMAKRAAGVRHTENRDMKATAVAWYLERRGSLTKDEAAEQIAGKVVPVKFRTVRDWLKGL